MDDPLIRAPSAEVLTYQSPLGRPSRSGTGFMAVCATILLPGLGHVIGGYRRRGLLWFASSSITLAAMLTCMAIPRMVPGLLVLLPIALAITLWSWVDAFRCARRTERPPIASAPLRWVAGFGFLALSGLLHPGSLLVQALHANFVAAFQTSTSSMAPTIKPGDRFVAHRKEPLSRWSLAVFTPAYGREPRVPLVKRVVGLPGETITIVNGQILINGNPISRPDGLGPVQTPLMLAGLPFNGSPEHPVALRANEYYVLGDSANSLDSRFWTTSYPGHQPGALPGSEIYGRVTFIYWPPSHWRRFP